MYCSGSAFGTGSAVGLAVSGLTRTDVITGSLLWDGTLRLMDNPACGFGLLRYSPLAEIQVLLIDTWGASGKTTFTGY